MSFDPHLFRNQSAESFHNVPQNQGAKTYQNPRASTKYSTDCVRENQLIM